MISAAHRLVDGLDDGCNSHSHADAHGRQAISHIAAASHFMAECREQTNTTSPKRVAKGNGTTVHVDDPGIQTELPHGHNGLGGECLVDLGESNVSYAQAGAFQCLMAGGNGADSHQLWSHPRHRH